MTLVISRMTEMQNEESVCCLCMPWFQFLVMTLVRRRTLGRHSVLNACQCGRFGTESLHHSRFALRKIGIRNESFNV